nr:MAG TPA: hypothetical protein [Caudoviricetes sp.]
MLIYKLSTINQPRGSHTADGFAALTYIGDFYELYDLQFTI